MLEGRVLHDRRRFADHLDRWRPRALQALKRPIWTVWISLYRQAFGIAFFVWLFVGVFHLNEIGVWFGIAAAVTTGLMISMVIASRVAAESIGGLWRASAPRGA